MKRQRAAIAIQSIARGMQARGIYMLQLEAKIKLQTIARRIQARRNFKFMIQSAFRERKVNG
jgi:hypothetical protein